MTTKNFKKAVLSLSAASLLTTGLSADIAANGAHLDLENYSRIIIDFNTSTSGTGMILLEIIIFLLEIQ